MNGEDAVRYLQQKIQAYEAEISRLQAERDALDTAISRKRSLLTSAQALLKDELRAAGRTEGDEESLSLAFKLADLTLTDAIFEIVSESPGPVHADQVLKTLREADKAPRGKQPKNSVVSLLLRGVEQGLYNKVGPNLFAATRDQSEVAPSDLP